MFGPCIPSLGCFRSSLDLFVAQSWSFPFAQPGLPLLPFVHYLLSPGFAVYCSCSAGLWCSSPLRLHLAPCLALLFAWGSVLLGSLGALSRSSGFSSSLDPFSLPFPCHGDAFPLSLFRAVSLPAPSRLNLPGSFVFPTLQFLLFRLFLVMFLLLSFSVSVIFSYSLLLLFMSFTALRQSHSFPPFLCTARVLASVHFTCPLIPYTPRHSRASAARSFALPPVALRSAPLMGHIRLTGLSYSHSLVSPARFAHRSARGAHTAPGPSGRRLSAFAAPLSSGNTCSTRSSPLCALF